VIVQLSQDVLADAQARVIDASLLHHLALTTPVSRVIAQPVPPWQMKAQWSEPDVSLGTDHITLSVEIQGGVRHILKGTNLTVEGTVSAACRPQVATADDGSPWVFLAAPTPLGLDLTELELTYKADPDAVSWIDDAIETTLLRPTVSAQLVGPLAGLPLSFWPSGPVPHRGGADPGWAVWLDPEAACLSVTAGPGEAATVPPRFLVASESANAAVALSETGLNRQLGSLCQNGFATGTLESADGPGRWQWNAVTARFAGSAVHISGELIWRNETITVDADLECSVASTGELLVRAAAATPEPAHGDAVIGAWAEMVRRVFYRAVDASPPDASSPGDANALAQRFEIPGAGLHVDAPAVSLTLADGYLAASYALPARLGLPPVTIDGSEPTATITQPDVPRQAARGLTVATRLTASLADATEEPFDFAWRIDDEPNLRADHGASTSLSKTPAPSDSDTMLGPTGDGSHRLATVKLMVIDILGRAGEVTFDAAYHPPRDDRPDDEPPGAEQPRGGRPRGRGPKLVAAAVAVIVLIALLFVLRDPIDDWLTGQAASATATPSSGVTGAGVRVTVTGTYAFTGRWDEAAQDIRDVCSYLDTAGKRYLLLNGVGFWQIDEQTSTIIPHMYVAPAVVTSFPEVPQKLDQDGLPTGDYEAFDARPDIVAVGEVFTVEGGLRDRDPLWERCQPYDALLEKLISLG
jgi:hypothetical protein